MSWPEAFATVGAMVGIAAIFWAFAWMEVNNRDDDE